MKRIVDISIGVVLSFGLLLVVFNTPAYLYSFNYWFGHNLGAAFTTLSSSDTVANFPTTYNANIAVTANTSAANDFSGLQTAPYASTTVFSCSTCYFGGTATSSITNGVLSLISPLTVASGGTGSTTLSQFSVLLGSSTNAIGIVEGFGTSGQILTSNGVGVAPTWQSGTVDESLDYTWTGAHSFVNSTTSAFAITTAKFHINGLDYRFPSTGLATNTVFMFDASGTASLIKPPYRLIASSTTGSAGLYATTSITEAPSHLKVVLEFNGASNETVRVRFNGDSASNYGYALNRDQTGAFVRSSGSATNSILLTNAADVSTTTKAHIEINIENTPGERKLATWQATMSNSGTNAPVNITGSGVWNNTSSVITDVVFDANTTQNIPSGARVFIYGY